ncbi:putative lectin family integral membrane protein [Kalaharituber pfeilii]|nr:putative lectin family integral membrane protein [Kalaharituber pfeilii]
MKFLSRWITVAFAALTLGPSLSSGQSRDDPDVKTVPLRTHSLYQPYLDSDLQSRWFDWGGDTVIRADQYIRLTGDRQDQAGWIWSRLPLTATNWEIEFEFKIHGKGSLYGDGLALWVTKQRAQGGPVFGSKDKFEGLGVFFDTYKNNRPGTVFPYVMAMLGDGQTSYNHANDGKDQELAGCSARGIRGSVTPTKGRLTYFQENYLQLELQYKDENAWVTCFNVPNVTLPTVSYLGFSAHCGELSDNHDIISITSNNLYTTKDRQIRQRKQAQAHWYPDKVWRQRLGMVLYQEYPFHCGGDWRVSGWVAYRTQKRSSRF